MRILEQPRLKLKAATAEGGTRDRTGSGKHLIQKRQLRPALCRTSGPALCLSLNTAATHVLPTASRMAPPSFALAPLFEFPTYKSSSHLLLPRSSQNSTDARTRMSSARFSLSLRPPPPRPPPPRCPPFAGLALPTPLPMPVISTPLRAYTPTSAKSRSLSDTAVFSSSDGSPAQQQPQPSKRSQRRLRVRVRGAAPRFRGVLAKRADGGAEDRPESSTMRTGGGRLL